MRRLTTALSEPPYRALKEAARRGESTGQLIDESLGHCGIGRREDAQAIFERAGQASRLREAQAMELAVSETRTHRGGT